MTTQFELAMCADVVENEIAQGATQREIARTYALAIRSSWDTDWARLNGAIVERWDEAARDRIKAAAWSGKWRGKPPFETVTS